MRIVLLLAALLLAAPAQAADKPDFKFSGTVKAGASYSHSLPHGLSFNLTPTDKGWQIEVHDKETPPQGQLSNLAAATLPLHGVNATQLEGWHFRNADNTAPNDGSVNTPQEERNFDFVTTLADLTRIFDYYDCLMSGGNSRCEEPTPVLWGNATLMITHKGLTPSAKGEQAAFTSLDFTVTGTFSTNHRIFP